MFARALVIAAGLLFSSWVGATGIHDSETEEARSALAEDAAPAKYAAVVDVDGKRIGTLLSEEPDLIENLSVQFSDSEVLEFKVQHFGADASVDAFLVDQSRSTEIEGKIVHERQPVGNRSLVAGQAVAFEIESHRSKKQAVIGFEMMDVSKFEPLVAEGKAAQTGCCRCQGVKCCPLTGKCLTCDDCGQCCKDNDA